MASSIYSTYFAQWMEFQWGFIRGSLECVFGIADCAWEATSPAVGKPRKDGAEPSWKTAVLEQRCQESVITNPQLDRHPWLRVLSQLGKVNVEQNLTGFGLFKMKGKADAVRHEKQYLVTRSDILSEYLSINTT